mgnify:CR=1 FL=1
MIRTPLRTALRAASSVAVLLTVLAVPAYAQDADILHRTVDELAAAIDLLDPGERSALLATIVKLIRRLQLADRIPIARVCVSCTHFEPFAHDEGPPHHCRFVDEPFGQESLRGDCADHAVAKDWSAEERWMTGVEISE